MYKRVAFLFSVVVIIALVGFIGTYESWFSPTRSLNSKDTVNTQKNLESGTPDGMQLQEQSSGGSDRDKAHVISFNKHSVEEVFGDDFDIVFEPNALIVPKNSDSYDQYYERSSQLTIRHKSDANRVYTLFMDQLKTSAEKYYVDSGLTPIVISGRKFFIHKDYPDSRNRFEYTFSLAWPIQGEFDMVRLDTRNLGTMDFENSDFNKLLEAFPFYKEKFDTYFENRANTYKNNQSYPNRVYAYETLKVNPLTPLARLEYSTMVFDDRVASSYYVSEVFAHPQDSSIRFTFKKNEGDAMKNVDVIVLDSPDKKITYQSLFSKAKKMMDTPSASPRYPDGTKRLFTKYYYDTTDGILCFISNTNSIALFPGTHPDDDFFRGFPLDWSSGISYRTRDNRRPTWTCSTDEEKFFQGM